MCLGSTRRVFAEAVSLAVRSVVVAHGGRARPGWGGGGLTAVVGQGTACDVVVQTVCDRSAAQGLQKVPAGFGRDVALGEVPADGEDDRGDVHHRVHPGPDRRPDRTAAVQDRTERFDQIGVGSGERCFDDLAVVGPLLAEVVLT